MSKMAMHDGVLAVVDEVVLAHVGQRVEVHLLLDEVRQVVGPARVRRGVALAIDAASRWPEDPEPKPKAVST
mgnify:CR=1 FL=1